MIRAPDLRQTVADQAHHISELEAMGERMGIYIREWRARGERIAELEAENKLLREANDALSAMLKPVE